MVSIGPRGTAPQLLGFEKSIPPYATASPEESVLGVNYASGSAGIRDETGQHMILYKYGARKFGIPGSSYSGCAPEMMTRYNTNVCVDAINGAVVQFNAKLVAALGELESKLTGAKFIYMNPSLGYSTGCYMGQRKLKLELQIKTRLQHHQYMQREMPETEWKDTSDARKVQKADREKLRREKLNYQFIELGNLLGNNITNF
ncbi:hypothetical protein Tco_1146935 [Tanacetum coccineum]